MLTDHCIYQHTEKPEFPFKDQFTEPETMVNFW